MNYWIRVHHADEVREYLKGMVWGRAIGSDSKFVYDWLKGISTGVFFGKGEYDTEEYPTLLKLIKKYPKIFENIDITWKLQTNKSDGHFWCSDVEVSPTIHGKPRFTVSM
jgi:hypothetical protein